MRMVRPTIGPAAQSGAALSFPVCVFFFFSFSISFPFSLPVIPRFINVSISLADVLITSGSNDNNQPMTSIQTNQFLSVLVTDGSGSSAGLDQAKGFAFLFLSFLQVIVAGKLNRKKDKRRRRRRRTSEPRRVVRLFINPTGCLARSNAQAFPLF